MADNAQGPTVEQVLQGMAALMGKTSEVTLAEAQREAASENA